MRISHEAIYQALFIQGSAPAAHYACHVLEHGSVTTAWSPPR